MTARSTYPQCLHWHLLFPFWFCGAYAYQLPRITWSEIDLADLGFAGCGRTYMAFPTQVCRSTGPVYRAEPVNSSQALL
ncbi:hypothetical protein BP00DRAFT_426977 [Aspergillus indologenus CBS 114.80]|uniref:Secreted protein n=1 Tax=Aspergillus indologenus CBS 114.80 TaxID=1450541 RepID=A0A2V5I7G7_9EURO|nr:hypothetical protein BP00DRAFT_426977 [Aspergillus indologenus CBS 114.80]